MSVTNTTVESTQTMCELVRKIAATKLTCTITLVLDNALYQNNAEVMELAGDLDNTLLFLPLYSINLNLIERLWKFIKRRSIYGRHHPAFANFKTTIHGVRPVLGSDSYGGARMFDRLSFAAR